MEEFEKRNDDVVARYYTGMGDGRFMAAFTLRNPKPGYDIPETTDYWKIFQGFSECLEWLVEKTGGWSRFE